ncbi:VOC family protein [Streptomyces sp. NBC_00083]|uniref:VOC family protein n=1 Tax=Streptomyces sp. NBC_00083 TaxID=2975647 RepID=UPI002251309D|nr:VOC family protein [Streptomyces sp. NBC_00083]MCX5386721.1 VOC family protein [Streptomyces sp. NBC_00083]
MLSTRYVTGSPSWFDLGTPDMDAAAAFYTGVFGWTYQPGGPEVGGYGTFQAAGKTIAGGMAITPEQGRPGWNLYFQTPDIEATARSVEQAGGKVVMPPMDVMELGRSAVLQDTAGVGFSGWQPQQMAGMEAAGERDTLAWVELYTPDVKAAIGFYHAVFGWESTDVPFPGGTYTTVNPATAGPDGMFGGIVPIDGDALEAEAGPYWMPYIEVADADATAARARELGGTVRMAPMDVEGVGRLGRIADPFGGRIAIITSAMDGS